MSTQLPPVLHTKDGLGGLAKELENFCIYCGGTGQVSEYVSKTGFVLFFPITMGGFEIKSCPKCHGSGKL